jgi:hypothetical protein
MHMILSNRAARPHQGLEASYLHAVKNNDWKLLLPHYVENVAQKPR